MRKTNTDIIYDELEVFYQIRGDNYGRKYLTTFLELVIKFDVPPEEYEMWFDLNKNKVGLNLKGSTMNNYQRVLKQFIKYVNLSHERNKRIRLKKNRPKKKNVKIHDTLYDFRKSNGLI